MSLFSWLFQTQATPPAVESSGLSRMEATRPALRGKQGPFSNAQPANRKSERMARRELLYSVVRESMMRAGVLSASYKFKVLSLDGRGRQFMVMVDLARDCGSETARLAEIEALIAQAAKSRHDIIVSAVYWRMNEHVAVGDPNTQLRRNGVNSQPAALDSHPAPLDSRPALLDTPPMRPARNSPLPPPEGSKAPWRYDPIQADEVAAFKIALAAGASKAAAAGAPGAKGAAGARALDGSGRAGARSQTRSTGFEDTELHEDRLPGKLSGTQYGEVG